MAAFNFRRRRTRRGWYVGATLVVAAFFATFFVVGASANLSGSTFEGNDGNLVVNTSGNTDWANVAGRNTGIDKPPGSTDNSFGQGTKEDNSAVSVVSGSIPPNKNDLTRFYEASEQAANNGDIFLYLAWERLVNIGNANLDFEINQNSTSGFGANTTGPVNLNRTAGDLLVTYDFGGSGTPTLGLNTWLTQAAGNTVSQCFSANALPCWGKHVTLNGANSEGGVNNGSITEPIAGTSLGTGLFGEAAIDLTAAGVFPAGSCEAFGSAFLKSRSSSSFTAEIKDFIAPIAVNVSNCGSITIHKVTENGDSTFGYSTTGGLAPSTFSLSNAGTQAYTKVTAGSYSVAESLTATQIADGWTLKSLTCLPPTGTGTSVQINGSTVNITEGNGGVVDCTYTNHINLKPTISTQLSATTVNIGDPVHDSATLAGATATAGGTVTYHAYAGANTCSGIDLLNSTKTVNAGVVPDSDPISFATAGVYSFQAVYSGDGNNNGATSTCSTEQLVVKTNPGITTTLSKNPVNIGETMHDSATLSGATSNAGGTVTYHAYAGANNCGNGPDLLSSQVNVTNGNVPDSAPISFATAGVYSFQAVYSGDGNNNGATSVCSTEQLVVKTNPGITTTLSKNPVDIGESMHDSAALSGATSDASGTVTYHAYAGANNCGNGPDLLNSQVNVTNGNVPDSGPISFLTAGVYSFQAVYSGDGKNNGATSTCSSEQLLVKANPTITTTLSATNVDVGSLVHDSATLSGQTGGAGGTVTYTVYQDPGCLLGARSAGTVNVSGGIVPDSNTLAFDTAGTFYWQAVYSGDLNNNGATSTCTDETLVVNKKQPAASTAQSLIPNDSFTLSGGFHPTGSITFNLFGPGDPTCSGTPAFTQTLNNVNGNATYSTTNTTFIATDEGTWRWQSTYSGDGNNFPADSTCGKEQFTIANH